MNKERLTSLYVKKKMPSSEIARVFRCSENRINYWLKKHNIQKRSISEAVYLKNNPNGDPFKIKEINTIKDAKLFGLGLGLYWGEGNKKNKNSVRLGNTDPRIIKKFMEFLLIICNADKKKFRFGLQVFNDMSAEKTLKFWLKELDKYDINRNQFFKITITPARSIGNYKEKSKYGVLTVHFCNVKLKNLIDSMLPL